MANWDTIYKDYKKGGQAWASLSEGIMPLFKRFLNNTDFKHKCALDIGCGTGKYLYFLSTKDFVVDGVDSSPTAIKMAKELLGKKAEKIKTVDMFKFSLGKEKYGLVISIAAIQHGFKKDIQKLVNKIHAALVENGKIFITIPDFESSKKWNTFKNHKDLGNGTFAPMSGPEKGLPHSFYTKAEIKDLFGQFNDLKLTLDIQGRWIVRASKRS